jgi:hypothetical protein
VEAVVPAPNGGYPGFNTAEGTNALQNLTTGVGNAAVGWYSLFSNTDGSYNTAVGAGTLLFNTGDQTTFEGVDNTAVGAAALLFNTTGTDNTATGAVALLNNTGGSNNTATGSFALQSNTTGNLNTATGLLALFSNTTGIGNTAEGGSVLILNTTGFSNTAIGASAGANQTTGSSNVYIGAGMSGVAGEGGACYIASIFSQTSASGIPVLINSSNKLGTTTSSKRFKEDIKPMDKASEALLALKPVTFRYKKEIDPAAKSQFGLVAEEVAEVNPDLVVRDGNGEIYTVRYDAVNAMLLSEFLKEHRTVRELKSNAAKQEATIAQQQKQIEGLTAGLQKVSAQLELSESAPQTVLNDR